MHAEVKNRYSDRRQRHQRDVVSLVVTDADLLPRMQMNKLNTDVDNNSDSHVPHSRRKCTNCTVCLSDCPRIIRKSYSRTLPNFMHGAEGHAKPP